MNALNFSKDEYDRIEGLSLLASISFANSRENGPSISGNSNKKQKINQVYETTASQQITGQQELPKTLEGRVMHYTSTDMEEEAENENHSVKVSLNSPSQNNSNGSSSPLVNALKQQRVIFNGKEFFFNEFQCRFLSKYSSDFKELFPWWKFSQDDSSAVKLDIDDLKCLHRFLSANHLSKLQRECEQQISEWLRVDIKARIGLIKDLSLHFLNLSHSAIDDEDVLSLRQFPLEVLKVSQCDCLTGIGLKSIVKELTELKELDLSYYKGAISQVFKNAAPSLAKLRALNLKDCRNLTDNTFAVIGPHLKELKSLNIQNCKDLSDQTIQVICTHLHQLRHLSLGDLEANLSDHALGEIGKNLRQLEFFKLGSCPSVQDKTIQKLCEQLVKLTHLSLHGCHQLSDQTVEAISKKAQLQYLDLSDCPKLTSYSLEMIFTDLKELRHLNMSHCQGLKDQEMRMFNENLSNLQFLDLSSCENLGDQIILAISQNFKRLGQLDLSKCAKISDQAITVTCENAQNLKFLNVSFCSKLTDSALTTIYTKLKKLRHLDIGSCQEMTNPTLVAMSENLTELQHLYLDKLVNLNDKTVEVFSQNLKQLRVLHLSDCTNLNGRIIVLLCQNLNHLGELSLIGSSKSVTMACNQIQKELNNRSLSIVSGKRNLISVRKTSSQIKQRLLSLQEDI